jgi:hypothetical protein
MMTTTAPAVEAVKAGLALKKKTTAPDVEAAKVGLA